MASTTERITSWAANLFWNVLGSAIWTGISGGAMMATMVVIYGYLGSHSFVLEKGITALCTTIVIGLIAAGSALIRGRLIRDSATPTPLYHQGEAVVVDSTEAPDSFAGLAIRQVYQSYNEALYTTNIWLLLSVVAGWHSILSIVRWEVSIKWINVATPAIAQDFYNSDSDSSDNGLYWWQGIEYNINLAWGELRLVPSEHKHGYLYCRFKNQNTHPIAEITATFWDISGARCSCKRVFNRDV